MAFRPFIRIRLGPDEEVSSKHINLVQDNVGAAVGQVIGKDILDRQTLDKVKLVPSGINYVGHGLGRPIIGVHVVRQYGTGTYINVWDVDDANTPINKKTQVYMMASATGIFKLEVF